MGAEASHLEAFIVSVLRGAAKLLGCNSTSLILINKRTKQIQIRIGAMAMSYPVLGQIERVLGSTFDGISLAIEEVRTSLIYRCWAERETFETSNLGELVGDTFPDSVTQQMAELAGQRRYVCVPAIDKRRALGVLLFEKEDRHPFSRQQREVLLRYARRIGELLESDPLEQGQLQRGAPPLDKKSDILIFDRQGALIGHGDGCALAHALIEGAEPQSELAGLCGQIKDAVTRARADDAPTPPETSAGPVTVTHVTLRGEALLHCAVRAPAKREVELENQLLQLTLGEDTAALFVDADFMITSLNDAALELFGASAAQELVGREVMTLFCEEEKIRDLLGQRILNPQTPHCEEQAIISTKESKLLPARVEALLLADDHQEAVGFMLLVHPSERDVAQPPMLQERLATMGEMAAQLAHEIRNPLVSIGAALDSLAKEALEPDAKRLVESLIKEVIRVDFMLKGYLSSPQDVALCEVNLAELIDDARGPLQNAHSGSGKRIAHDIAPALSLYGDAEALRQLFFNVLLNALDASPSGGLVQCSAECRAHDLIVTVDDSGGGLSADAAECFRPFFTTKSNGTGLGLTVCQKIVSAHGGLMRLSNLDEGGCRAEMIFPQRRRAMES